MKNLDYFIRRCSQKKKIELKQKQIYLEDIIQYIGDIDNPIEDKNEKRLGELKEYLEYYGETGYLDFGFIENLAISDENSDIRLLAFIKLCSIYKFEKMAYMIDYVIKNDLNLIEELFKENIPIKEIKEKNKIYDKISLLDYSFYQFLIVNREFFKTENFDIALIRRYEQIKRYFKTKNEPIEIQYNDLVKMSYTNQTEFLGDTSLIFIHKEINYPDIYFYSITLESFQRFLEIKEYFRIPDTQIKPSIKKKLLVLKSINPIKQFSMVISFFIYDQTELQYYVSNFKFPHLKR